MGAMIAPVTETRSAGAIPRSSPRRPADTYTTSYAVAVSSTTVGSGRFWPTGEMPPMT